MTLSHTRLSNNRSVMPLDVLSRPRTPLRTPTPRRPHACPACATRKAPETREDKHTVADIRRQAETCTERGGPKQTGATRGRQEQAYVNRHGRTEILDRGRAAPRQVRAFFLLNAVRHIETAGRPETASGVVKNVRLCVTPIVRDRETA